MQYDTEKMRLYQRERRAKLKGKPQSYERVELPSDNPLEEWQKVQQLVKPDETLTKARFWTIYWNLRWYGMSTRPREANLLQDKPLSMEEAIKATLAICKAPPPATENP